MQSQNPTPQTFLLKQVPIFGMAMSRLATLSHHRLLLAISTWAPRHWQISSPIRPTMAHAAVHGCSEGLYVLFPFVMGIGLSYFGYHSHICALLSALVKFNWTLINIHSKPIVISLMKPFEKPVATCDKSIRAIRSSDALSILLWYVWICNGCITLLNICLSSSSIPPQSDLSRGLD